MPTYEYACAECSREFEVFQSIKDEPLKTCDCGKNGAVRRKIGRGAGIIFKGSGFYETDYKRSPAPAAKAGSSGEGGANATPAAPAKTETKPAAKPSTSSE